MPQLELRFFIRQQAVLVPWFPQSLGVPAGSFPIGAKRLHSELHGSVELGDIEVKTHRIRIGVARPEEAEPYSGGPYVIFGRTYTLVFALGSDFRESNLQRPTHSYTLKVPSSIPPNKIHVLKIVMNDIEIEQTSRVSARIVGKISMPAISRTMLAQVIYQQMDDGNCVRTKLESDGTFSLPAGELGGSLCVLGENAPLGCSLYYVGKVDKRSYTFPGDEDLAGHSKLLKLKIHIPEHYVKLHEKSRRLAVCLYPSKTNALPFSVAKVYSDDWDAFLKNRVVSMDAVPGTFVVRIGMAWASTITIDASPATHDITLP